MDAARATPKISFAYGRYWISYCGSWIAVKVPWR